MNRIPLYGFDLNIKIWSNEFGELGDFPTIQGDCINYWVSIFLKNQLQLNFMFKVGFGEGTTDQRNKNFIKTIGFSRKPAL